MASNDQPCEKRISGDPWKNVILLECQKVKEKKLESLRPDVSSPGPGGLTETQAKRVRETRPERMVEEAIQGMLPKSKLGKQMYRKLQVYAGPKHPHQAQKPVELTVAG